ncbi:hypothetical protein Tco_1034233 [Tanacetum coccineum]
MLPSTPLVLLESMGPYGSTGLDAAEKNATLLIDLCCSSCMHFGNKKDGSSTVFGGRVGGTDRKVNDSITSRRRLPETNPLFAQSKDQLLVKQETQ